MTTLRSRVQAGTLAALLVALAPALAGCHRGHAPAPDPEGAHAAGRDPVEAVSAWFASRSTFSLLALDTADHPDRVTSYQRYGRGAVLGLSASDIRVIGATFDVAWPPDVEPDPSMPSGRYAWWFVTIRRAPDAGWEVDDWGPL